MYTPLPSFLPVYVCRLPVPKRPDRAPPALLCLSAARIREWLRRRLLSLQDRPRLFIPLLVVIAATADAAVAADTATRLATRLEAAVETDGRHLGAHGEQADEWFDENAYAVFHREQQRTK